MSRTQNAADCFGAVFADLRKRWTGSWAMLEKLAPTLVEEIDEAEREGELIALAFARAAATKEELERAMGRYRTWMERAAGVLAKAARMNEPCDGCGRTDFIVAVRDDLGVLTCRRCLQGAATVELHERTP